MLIVKELAAVCLVQDLLSAREYRMNRSTLQQKIAEGVVYGCTEDEITVYTDLAMFIESFNAGEMLFGDGRVLGCYACSPYVKRLELTAVRKGSKSLHVPSFVYLIGHSNSVRTQGFHQLEQVRLEEGLRGIADACFFGCTYLREINFPSTVKQIGLSAFAGCASLTSLDLSRTKIKELPAQTFHACLNIREVLLPDTLVSVDRTAFVRCSSVERLVLPNAKTNRGFDGDSLSWFKALREVEYPEKCDIQPEAFFYSNSEDMRSRGYFIVRVHKKNIRAFEEWERFAKAETRIRITVEWL